MIREPYTPSVKEYTTPTGKFTFQTFHDGSALLTIKTYNNYASMALDNAAEVEAFVKVVLS